MGGTLWGKWRKENPSDLRPQPHARSAVGVHNLFALQFSPLSGDKLICTWKWSVTGGAAVSLGDRICRVQAGLLGHSPVVVVGA